MENQEMVMEKSWTNILSSLWEPCTVKKCLKEQFLMTVTVIFNSYRVYQENIV